ncbi:MAG: Outer membrane protein transport protein (OMPP1/FadL/TodX) [Chlorobi bacterium OLB4]|nr:MAG: Outer membrane protein transport protein (OMPP1/FadL/TodX) [Chlorobi bacterium OLB4]MBV6398349.1 hypothetical protein [Ignavibacteria bacterium]
MLPIVIYSQNDGAGNTGFAFLKLGVGAPSISMGDAYSSLTDDATAVIYNPARLINGANTNVVLMHSNQMEDLNHDFIAGKMKISDKFAFGIGFLKTGISDIEIRQIPGEREGEFNAEYLSMGVSAAYKLSEFLTVGATGKFIYEKLYVDDASGVAFDIGANYIMDDLSLSAVLSNFGSVNGLRHVETKLPTAIRLGAGYTQTRGDFAFRFGLEGYKIIDGGSFHINSGGELGYKEIVFVRVGYQTAYENRGLTTGIGLKYKNFNVDYAYVPYSLDFGNSNTFSLGISF